MEDFQNCIRSGISDYNLQIRELRVVEGEESE